MFHGAHRKAGVDSEPRAPVWAQQQDRQPQLPRNWPRSLPRLRTRPQSKEVIRQAEPPPPGRGWWLEDGIHKLLVRAEQLELGSVALDNRQSLSETPAKAAQRGCRMPMPLGGNLDRLHLFLPAYVVA